MRDGEIASGQAKFSFKKLFSQCTQIAVLTAALLCMVVVCVWNAVQLNNVLLHVTQNYVEDVSRQLTNDVAAQLNGDLDVGELIADSIPHIRNGNVTDAQIQAYLDRKAEMLGFDCMTLLRKDGTMTTSHFCIADLDTIPSVRNAFSGERGISHVCSNNLVYAVPIYDDTHSVQSILVGVREQENVQQMIQPRSFNGMGLSCIIDTSGKVIVSPTDVNPFNELGDLSSSETTQREINKMQRNMKENVSGAFCFRAVTGENIIMSYQDIGIGDWVMLVLVPADLITDEAISYVVRTVVVVSVIVVLLLLFLLVVRQFYYNYNKKLERIAYVDELTGGMNMAAFQEEYRILAQKMQPLSYAVVLFNTKGFKLINEGFGLEAGDNTLRYIYKVLNNSIDKDELLGRSESDYFFLCLHESRPQRIRERLQKMEQDINQFNRDRVKPYMLAFFQGVYVIDDPSLESTIVQGRARAACRSQRLSGQTGCSFYSNTLAEQLQLEQDLDSLFDDAIAHKEFKVCLQPKIRLQDGAVVGAEALVRWQHPTRGLMSPMTFIPLLEKSSKICTLDLYVFETVCALQERWRKEGRPQIPVSVNLSRQHFNDADFLQPFIDVAKKYQLVSNMIEFEVTESIFSSEQRIPFVRHGIQQMHEHGFLCSLDDFGSGFSSLGMLRAFDVDVLKLDRSFFTDMHNEKTQSIIACLVDLANKLQIQTVAEGIETAEQLDYLRKIHCDVVQGYVFSRPMFIDDFEQWQQQMLTAGISTENLDASAVQ